jgi:hypothetical protein
MNAGPAKSPATASLEPGGSVLVSSTPTNDRVWMCMAGSTQRCPKEPRLSPVPVMRWHDTQDDEGGEPG